MHLHRNINSQKSLYTNIGLHNLSPYVGKIRPELAKHLVKTYAEPKGIVYDPFCGSGTVSLEAWANHNDCLATDLNCYAIVLTKGKLMPFQTLEKALDKINKIHSVIEKNKPKKRAPKVPTWVSAFYHPNTFLEILLWVEYLRKNREWFLLSCLMGILHHQRPGFLSFPSSHGAPYLRDSKYPRELYPSLYEYRSLFPRLEKKIIRVYKNFPNLDFKIKRTIRKVSSYRFKPRVKRISTIITSPPYMKSLTYARDNRLRLWFLGEFNWRTLDKIISPSKEMFSGLIEKSFKQWRQYQVENDYCIIVIGDIPYNNTMRLPELIYNQAEMNGYSLEKSIKDPIPYERRFCRKDSKINSECILIFKRRK